MNSRAPTLTAQTAMPFLVRVQKRYLRGPACSVITGSGGILGSAGTVERTRAVEVGKYMGETQTLTVQRVYALSKSGTIDIY